MVKPAKRFMRIRKKIEKPISHESESLDSVVTDPPSVSNIAAKIKVIDESNIDSFLLFAQKIANIEAKAGKMRQAKKIVFVAPSLPHPSEMDLWNIAVAKIGAHGLVITAHTEAKAFEAFVEKHRKDGSALRLECVTLDTVSENRTFLAGLEPLLVDASIVVALGETSLATYQVLKARRQLQNRMVVWQTAPRPPEAVPGARSVSGALSPDLGRIKSIRREILKTCDALLAFDKDSSTWAYLEGVNAQRIRRITRGIDLRKFSTEINATQRIALRAGLGLPETDFIFLQAGPLEIETGALDSIYAFKSLLQSHPSYLNNTKLVFCGTGSSGADVKQAVVNLQLDEHVFFLNPNDPSTKEMLGNQIANLLAISDAIIHNPITAVNGNPDRNLDCTYDILCALASGLTVVSNGNGWVGDWLSRFLKTFSVGCIHSQSKLMRDSIEKQEKLNSVKKSIRTAMENEITVEKAGSELAAVFQSLMATEIKLDSENVLSIFASIDETVKAKRYLDAIQLISKAFEIKTLTESQRASLFRYIGDCFTKLGDLENGNQNYLRALELDPYCAKSYIGLGTVALQRREFNVAVPHFQKAITLSPSDDLANLGLSIAFESMGELNEALQWALRSCNLNIESTPAIFNLVRLSYELEQYEGAEVVLSHYVSLHPYDVNMTFTLAGLSFKMQKFDIAMRLVETILMLDPDNVRAHGLANQIQRKAIDLKQA